MGRAPALIILIGLGAVAVVVALNVVAGDKLAQSRSEMQKQEEGPFAALSVSLDDAWGASWSNHSRAEATLGATSTCKSRAREPATCEPTVVRGTNCVALVKTPPDFMAVFVESKKDKKSFGVRVGTGRTPSEAVQTALAGSGYGIAEVRMNVLALKALICADKPDAVTRNVNW